jgi:hypothetical protein
MIIRLTQAGAPHSTDLIVEHDVTITDAFNGPIISHDGLNVSIYARDSGFEGAVWRGAVGHGEALPADAVMFSIQPEAFSVKQGERGVTKGLDWNE